MEDYLIDSHAHLTSNDVYPQIDDILGRAAQARIRKIVNICTDQQTLLNARELCRKYPWVFFTAATTPHDVEKIGEEDFTVFADSARKGELVAVGETGLDYYYEHSNRDIQKKFLVKYLHLALECQLPVVIHCREAFRDFFEILDQEYVVNSKHAPGVLHCFTGTLPEAEEVIKRGWYLSLSGIVTFKKSAELHEVAKMVPLSHLLIETDTPYLAPQSKRGKPNEPAFIAETASFIAYLKGCLPSDVIKATSRNAEALFKI